MKSINKNKMRAVILAALGKVAGDKRWTSAITRAAVEIENNPVMIWYAGTLLIVSPSGMQYTRTSNHKP